MESPSMNYEVHPVAALFPMMSEDELADLAEDIKQNGLVHPVVRDKDDVVIDGRNRLAACEIAGVEPAFTTLNGQDPVAFILSANVARRHLSKGQQAMVVAKANSFYSQREAARATGLSQARIMQASVVLQYAPDLADGVIAGSESLDKAYETARQRKQAAESAPSQMTELREIAPDLADLVVEERMALAEAMTVAKQRVQKEQERRQRHTHQFATSLVLLTDFSRDKPVEEFLEETYTADANGMRADPTVFEAESIKALATWLSRLSTLVRKGTEL